MTDIFLLGNSGEKSAEIDMGPLIDMVFILLIFFIITTNFNRQTGVDVTKPKSASAISQGAKTIMIGITTEGSVHLYGRQVSMDRLGMIIGQEVTKAPETSIIIVADKDASIGKAIEVMDRCTIAGAAKVSIAADQEG